MRFWRRRGQVSILDVDDLLEMGHMAAFGKDVQVAPWVFPPAKKNTLREQGRWGGGI